MSEITVTTAVVPLGAAFGAFAVWLAVRIINRREQGAIGIALTVTATFWAVLLALLLLFTVG